MADCSLTECEAGGMRNFRPRKADVSRPVSGFPQTEPLCFEIVPWIYHWTFKKKPCVVAESETALKVLENVWCLFTHIQS